MMNDLPGLAASYADLACTGGLFGIFVYQWLWPTRNTPGEGFDLPANRLVRVHHLVSFSMILISLWLLALRTAAMSGLPVHAALPLAGTVLLHTSYGFPWLLRVITIAALWWAGRRPEPGLRFGLVPAALLGLAWSRSATGHGADWGHFTAAEIMDWLHVTAGSLWGGGLALYSIMSWSGPAEPASPHGISEARFLRRLSRLAGWAVLVVVISGIFNASQQIGGGGALFGSDYGSVLMFKVTLVMAMIVLGATNRLLVLPALLGQAGVAVSPSGSLPPCGDGPPSPWAGTARARPLHWFRRIAGMETMIYLMVLLCAAALHGLAPPGHGQ